MKKLLLLSILLSGMAYSQEFEFNIPMINKPHEVIKFSAESGKTYNWDRCYGQTTQLLSEDGISCEKVINSRSGFTGSVVVCVTATKDYLSDPYCFAMCGSESVTWGNCTASLSLSEHLEIKNITNTDNRYVGTAEMLCTDGVWSIKSSNCEDNLASCGTDHNTVNNTPSNLCEIGTASSVTANANTMNWNCTTSANTVVCLSYKVALCDNATFNGCSVGTSSGYTSVVTDTTATWNCTNSTSTANCSKAKTTVSGACGSSNGQTLGSQPSTNLCTTGTASVVANGTNEYTWSCGGSENTDTTSVGATVNCSATKLAVCDTTTFGGCTQGTSAYTSAIGASSVNWTCTSGSSSVSCNKSATVGTAGTCGTANGSITSTAPSANLCAAGTATSVTNGANSFTWSCNGDAATQTSTAGTNESCNATKTAVCDNNTFQGCTLGTASAYTSAIGATTATWNCVNGSSSMACSKVKLAAVNGSCGSANGTMVATKPSTNLCNSGTPSTVVTNTTNHTWTCQGSVASHNQIGGSSSNCSANREPICASGLTWNGSVCTGTETQAASTYCPSGYRSGSSCYQDYSYPVSYTCPSGTSLSGSTCSGTRSQPANASCPSGYSYDSEAEWCYGTCSRLPNQAWSCENARPSFSCSSGWSLSGAYCYQSYTTSPTASSCSSGETKSGGYCYGTSNLGSVSYTCPSGWNLSGSTCSRTTNQSPIGYK